MECGQGRGWLFRQGSSFHFGKRQFGLPGVTADEDVGARRIGPMALVVKAGEGANGAKDGTGGDFHTLPVLDEAFGDEADVLAAENVEARGASVAVESVGVFEMEVTADEVGAIPLEIGGFDGVEVRAATDLAFAAVALKVWNGCGAFGHFGLGSGAEAACGLGKRGRGISRSAPGFCLSFFGVGLFAGDEREFVFERSVTGGDGSCVAAGAAFGDDFVERGFEDDFDWGVVWGHVCFLL